MAKKKSSKKPRPWSKKELGDFKISQKKSKKEVRRK